MRSFLSALEERKMLRRVNGAHWDLQIGTIHEIVSEKNGPSLLFDEIPEYPAGFRIATNLLNHKLARLEPRFSLLPRTNDVVYRDAGRFRADAAFHIRGDEQDESHQNGHGFPLECSWHAHQFDPPIRVSTELDADST